MNDKNNIIKTIKDALENASEKIVGFNFVAFIEVDEIEKNENLEMAFKQYIKEHNIEESDKDIFNHKYNLIEQDECIWKDEISLKKFEKDICNYEDYYLIANNVINLLHNNNFTAYKITERKIDEKGKIKNVQLRYCPEACIGEGWITCFESNEERMVISFGWSD